MQRHAHWFLRLPFAAIFVSHGMGKLMMPEMAEAMQMPVALFLTVGMAELLAGMGAFLGGIPAFPKRDLITRLAGLAAAPVMLGAIMLVHWPQWTFMATEAKPAGGMEFQVAILGLAVYFLLVGTSKEA